MNEKKHRHRQKHIHMYEMQSMSTIIEMIWYYCCWWGWWWWRWLRFLFILYCIKWLNHNGFAGIFDSYKLNAKWIHTKIRTHSHNVWFFTTFKHTNAHSQKVFTPKSVHMWGKSHCTHGCFASPLYFISCLVSIPSPSPFSSLSCTFILIQCYI